MASPGPRRLTWSEVAARRLARQALAAGHGPTRPASRGAVRRARPGARGRRAGDRSADRGSDAKRRAAGAVAGPDAWSRRSVRAARSTCWRPRTCRCGPARCRPCRSPSPQHPEPVRFTPAEADEVIAAIGDALADAELTVDELTDAIRERTGPWAVERTMDAFQDKWPRWRQLDEHRGPPRRAVLRAGPGPQRDLHQPAPLAARLPARGRVRDAVRALVRRYLHAFGPATPEHFARWLGIPPRRRGRCSRRWATSSSASSWTATAPGSRRATPDVPSRPPRGRPPAALLRRLRRRGPAPGAAVPGRGRRSRAHAVRPGRELPGRCWSTASSAASGTSGAPAASSRSRSSRWASSRRRNAASSRRRWRSSAGCSKPTPVLTIGTVTVGAHA